MNLVKLKNKIKHFNDEPVYCHAISNNCVESKWHTFFDVDKQLEQNEIDLFNGLNPDDGVEFLPTHHGTQIINPKCKSLQEVYQDFQYLKLKFKTDYFWSVPLWLRFTSKESISGKVDSQAPPYPPEILNHFQIRKLYQTWD